MPDFHRQRVTPVPASMWAAKFGCRGIDRTRMRRRVMSTHALLGRDFKVLTHDPSFIVGELTMVRAGEGANGVGRGQARVLAEQAAQSPVALPAGVLTLASPLRAVLVAVSWWASTDDS